MPKYKVVQFDHFYKYGHAARQIYLFETKEDAEKFLEKEKANAKLYPSIYERLEFVLCEINHDAVKNCNLCIETGEQRRCRHYDCKTQTWR